MGTHSGGTVIQGRNYVVQAASVTLSNANATIDIPNMSIPASNAELVQAIAIVTTAGTVTGSAVQSLALLNGSDTTLLTDSVAHSSNTSDGGDWTWIPVAAVATGSRGDIVRVKTTVVGTVDAPPVLTVTCVWAL